MITITNNYYATECVRVCVRCMPGSKPAKIKDCKSGHVRGIVGAGCRSHGWRRQDGWLPTLACCLLAFPRSALLPLARSLPHVSFLLTIPYLTHFCTAASHTHTHHLVYTIIAIGIFTRKGMPARVTWLLLLLFNLFKNKICSLLRCCLLSLCLKCIAIIERSCVGHVFERRYYCRKSLWRRRKIKR